MGASLMQLEDGIFQGDPMLETVSFQGKPAMLYIGKDVFSECISLTDLALPSTVKVIDARAFYRCKALKKIALPDALERIDDSAFKSSGLTTLTLPTGLKVLGDSAFFHCKYLTEVVIPESVETIGKWVFHGCNRLKTIEFRHDPVSIGEWMVNKSTTVRCYKGSAVDAYCETYGLTREYL